MSARIREEAGQIGTRPGILRGLGVTGGVITAAGIVMAGIFAALAQLPDVSVAEVGMAVALGVLLDTLPTWQFSVRPAVPEYCLCTTADRVPF